MYHFLFIMLTFYSKEVIKFYSTLKMSLLHADKVSFNLKQNQGVASLTNFCDAEPIKKNLIWRRQKKLQQIRPQSDISNSTSNKKRGRFFRTEKVYDM